MRSLGPALALWLIAIAAPAAAQTGERDWQPARHRFETEQGLAERSGTGLSSPCVPVETAPESECLDADAGGGTFYYVSQYRARVRLETDLRAGPRVDIDDDAEVALELDVSWRVVASEGGGAFGPMVIGVSGAWLAPDVTVRGGAGLGMPVQLVLSGADLGWAPLDALLAPFGHTDAWLAYGLPFVVHFRFEGRWDVLFGGVDTAGAVLLTAETYYGQIGGFVGVRPIEELAIGAHIDAAIDHRAFHGGEATEGYVSMTTFARLDTRPAFAELRFLVNLDEPFGPSFEPRTWWSLRALLGWETD